MTPSAEALVKQGLLFRPIEGINIERLVLIGFRGAGKSRMARQLESRIGWRAISTDAEIENRLRMTIREFVKDHGWPAFRELESRVIREVCERQQVIVDTGGGVVEREENMALLTRNAVVIWVDAPEAVLVERLREGNDRPLLTAQNWEADVRENYQRRLPLYRRYAHLYVNTARPETKELILNYVSTLGV